MHTAYYPPGPLEPAELTVSPAKVRGHDVEESFATYFEGTPRGLHACVAQLVRAKDC